MRKLKLHPIDSLFLFIAIVFAVAVYKDLRVQQNLHYQQEQKKVEEALKKASAEKEKQNFLSKAKEGKWLISDRAGITYDFKNLGMTKDLTSSCTGVVLDSKTNTPLNLIPDATFIGQNENTLVQLLKGKVTGQRYSLGCIYRPSKSPTMIAFPEFAGDTVTYAHFINNDKQIIFGNFSNKVLIDDPETYERKELKLFPDKDAKSVLALLSIEWDSTAPSLVFSYWNNTNNGYVVYRRWLNEEKTEKLIDGGKFAVMNPQGTTLAFVDEHNHISFLDMKTGEVTDDMFSPDANTVPLVMQSPVWSPEGDYLLFTYEALDQSSEKRDFTYSHYVYSKNMKAFFKLDELPINMPTGWVNK
jgi:hypothetical protein